MISYRELVSALRGTGLLPSQPVLVHASLSSFGDEIRGGPDALIGALLANASGMLVPTFTYKTMLIPETGPEGNASSYGRGKDTNRMAEFFSMDMPVDPLMGLLPETLRKRPEARRSSHPILSFAGIGLDDIVASQSVCDPLGPLGRLADMDGQVVLIGVDQRVNTSIHLAEARAGRKQFVRWALTPDGVRECPGFPGCSEGFNQAALLFEDFNRRVRVGEATIQVISLRRLYAAVSVRLAEDPLALLCGREDCQRCAAVRASVDLPAYLTVE
jgi:aminoglycoside 3-N-acetyltransferase